MVNVSALSELMFHSLCVLTVVYVHGVSRGVALEPRSVLNGEQGGLFFPACCFLAAWVPSEIWLSPIPRPCTKARIPNVSQGLSEVFSADAACVAARQHPTLRQ